MAVETRTNPTPLPPTPDGWQEMQIEELCERVTSGGTPSRKRPEFYENGAFRWFKTKELKDCALDDSEERITQDALDSSSAKLFPPNTVLMAMYGDGKTITSLGILRREAASNQACCAMIPESKVCNHRFLFYSLLNHREDFIRIATGGAQRNLSGNLIRRFALNVPPLSEQKAIASILGALDDKIELNRRMNATLEAMARALFQSWFVDFDPVRAKMDGRKPVGMDEATAGLFPKGFQVSPQGEIPHGWRIGNLGELVQLCNDRVDATPDKNNSRYIALEDMPSKSIALSNFQYGSAVNSSITAFRKGDVLFGSMRPYFHKVGLAFFDGITRTTTFVLRPKKDCFRHFALLHFFSDDVVSHSTITSVGTTIPYVRWDSMESYQIPIPPDSFLSAFEAKVSPLVQRIAAQGEESRTLVKLRESLLPKLLSGEVIL